MSIDPLKGARSAWDAGQYDACIAGALLTIAECLNAVVKDECLQVETLANVYSDDTLPVTVEMTE